VQHIVQTGEINGFKVREFSFAAIVVLAIVVFVTFFVSQGTNQNALMAIVVFIPGVIALYFAPALAASLHKHPQRGAIAILNLFLGWTVIGWVAALVWAYIAPSKTESDTSERRRHPASVNMRPCPFCAEDVRAEAIKCRHCQSDLTATITPGTVQPAALQQVARSA
jgi:hypothetical protein